MQHLPFMLWERLQSSSYSPSSSCSAAAFDGAAASFPPVRDVATASGASTETPGLISPAEANWGLAPGPKPSLEAESERTALRWRGTLLRLSDSFTATAAAHPELAPVLLEALGNALEQLLLFGRERDLSLLEEWLDEENS